MDSWGRLLPQENQYWGCCFRFFFPKFSTQSINVSSLLKKKFLEFKVNKFIDKVFRKFDNRVLSVVICVWWRIVGPWWHSFYFFLFQWRGYSLRFQEKNNPDWIQFFQFSPTKNHVSFWETEKKKYFSIGLVVDEKKRNMCTVVNEHALYCKKS